MTARSLEERQARDLLRRTARERAKAKPREPKEKKAVRRWNDEVEVPPRPRVTAAEKRLVLARHGGRCSHLGCTETQGLEIDHHLARDLGGKDHVDNYVPLCGPHHKVKTARDMKMIARARRIRKDMAEPKAPGSIRSPGFDRTYRPMASKGNF